MASEQTIAEMLALLCAQWPREPVSELTLRVYQYVLADIPDEVLRAAVLDLLKTCTFRPTAAEVRRACGVRMVEHNVRSYWQQRMLGSGSEDPIWYEVSRGYYAPVTSLSQLYAQRAELGAPIPDEEQDAADNAPGAIPIRRDRL